VQPVADALWFALPVVAAGAMHIAAIRADVLPALARMPIDAGLTLRGRRLFGDNKTLRGLILMPFFTTAMTTAQTALAGRYDWARTLTPQALSDAGPVSWGLLLGLGYVLGELPNSFLKRQIEIAPGEAGRGPLGPVFWIVDQVDSLIGALLAISLLWVPPWPVVSWLLAITLIVHPLAALAMVSLGLKSRVG
jgi:CDP-2,3-bis-(O-geranylgeranyl)-sn-glycerol synthase